MQRHSAQCFKVQHDETCFSVSDGLVAALHVRGQGVLEWDDQRRDGS